MVYNTSQAIGGEVANMIYYCYNFYYSANYVMKNRLALFSDFEDLYSSFLFNLMANSISIKNIAMKIYYYNNDEKIMGRGPLMAG